MTPDEIRAMRLTGESMGFEEPRPQRQQEDQARMLREIAAQLAEANQHLKVIADSLYADGMARHGGQIRCTGWRPTPERGVR